MPSVQPGVSFNTHPQADLCVNDEIGAHKMKKKELGDSELPSTSSRVGTSCRHHIPLMLDQGEEDLNPAFSFAPSSPCELLFPGNAASPTRQLFKEGQDSHSPCGKGEQKDSEQLRDLKSSDYDPP